MSMYKKKQPFKQQVGLWQGFYSSITNFGYGVRKQFHQIKQKFEPKEDLKDQIIIIQGKRYRNRKEAKEAVRKIMWFSYRKGFNIQNEYMSDVGWGCLLRVAQMALASALLKYFQSEKQMNQFLEQEDFCDNLITVFTDFQGRQQKYSLNQIMKIANKQYAHKPGQWFDLSKISYCLRIAQNHYPMKGAQNLQVVFFDQSINIPTIFKIQLLKECRCSKKIIVCEKCHSDIRPSIFQQVYVKNFEGKFELLVSKTLSNSKMMDKKQKISLTHKTFLSYSPSTNDARNNLEVFRHRRLNRDLFLLVLGRVGDQRNVQKVNEAIFSLLDLNICMGIMTGFPKKAIFVVGRQNNKLIYIDPHYVQKNEGLWGTNKESYICHQYLTTERIQLDPSMTFCFYIQTLNELEILENTVRNVNSKFKDQLSIGVDFGWCDFKQNDYLEVIEQTQMVAQSDKMSIFQL